MPQHFPLVNKGRSYVCTNGSFNFCSFAFVGHLQSFFFFFTPRITSWAGIFSNGDERNCEVICEF